MRTKISRFWNVGLLGVALLAPAAITPVTLLAAGPQVYHDDKYNTDHHWDAHESKAYRMWLRENHRKYVDFAKLKETDRQSYWAWRHDHSDVVLKIK